MDAASLQQLHARKYVFDSNSPDPFPAWPTTEESSNSKPVKPQKENVDVTSESAFPSLPTAAPKQANGVWGQNYKPTYAPVIQRSLYQNSFSIPQTQVQTALASNDNSREGRNKPKTTTELFRRTNQTYNVTVDSSTASQSKLTTFLVKGQSQKSVNEAINYLITNLSRKITVSIEVPSSCRAILIGPKGSTLKSITDSTKTRIQIPPKTVNDQQRKPNNNDDDSDDEQDDQPIQISIEGHEMSIQQAQQKIYEITSQVIQSYTKRLKTIPTSFYPLISVKVAQIEQQFNVQITIPSQARLRAIAHQAIGEESETTENERVKLSSIIIKGEKQNIKLAISSLERNYSDCQRTTKTISIPIPKRQHRTLVGSIGDEILEISQCIVELPPADDISETCTIRGPQVKLPAALQLVMEKASALAVETVDLLNTHKVKVDINYGKSLLRFLLRGGKLRKIADNHPGAKIYPPRQGYIEKSNSVVIDIVSQDSKAAIDARNDVESLIKTIPPSAINYFEIDHLLHRHLIGKQSRLFEDQQSITLLFPNENDQSDQITLIYFGASQLGLDGKALDNKVKEIIENAKNQLLELGKAAANITLEIISVEPKFHKSIIGSGGSTLNAVIGEDKIVDVQLGTSKLNENNNSRNKKDLKENEISIRGPKEEVERVANEIRKIANEAENHHLIYGHETELIVNSQFVAHIVGKNGTSISKLRESLDVQIDINQRLQNDNKKGVQKAIIKITGRKENAEEAKRRLSSLVELLADQTTEKLNIAKQYHASLIGSGGKYAIRLEEKHGVRITFPKNDDQSDNSEVIIKGGKKGVSQAKSELLEALEFEKENNNTLNISIPSSAIARIVGKGGYQINEIKENSLAQIDFDRSSQGPKTTIILKGTKKAINNAKNEILKIIDQINSQITIIIDDIDIKYHKSIIGQGGQKLRELITKAGGKTDSSTSQLVQFPKQNSGDNNIVIKGEKSLAANMEKEIREFVKEISDRKTIGVSVPVILHGDLIGRGGFKMLEFQKKFNVTLYFPGSRDYKSTDKVVNENELTDVKEESIIKITGKTSNVQNAVEELKNKSNIHSKSIEIENKHYSVISDGGRFFRNLRSNGVMIDISNENENNLNLSKSKYTANIPQPTSLEIPTPTSRVDDDTEDEISYNWELKQIDNVEIEGKSIWTINGKDESSVNKTIEKINKLIEINSNTQFVGYLILQNRSTFPRIVGSKGSGIERVKNESGVQQLTVSKNDLPLITFIGSKESVEYAKDLVLAIRPGNNY